MKPVDGLRALRRQAVAPLRRRILTVLRGSPSARLSIDYSQPVGDPGLFGPDSVTWKIHSDFPAMMAGGICALMLQTLHPTALAGVWDHSDFREDVLGRLRRTTAFVAGTTYAPTAGAEGLIEQVRNIHRRVRGTAPDGSAYAADDPELLSWVHVTEMWSFLQGYRRHVAPELDRALADRYFDETRRIAEALGAHEVPGSVAAVDQYFEAVRGQLEFSARSREVLAVLNRIELPMPGATAVRGTFLGAGAALLPDWAAQLLGRTALRRARDRAAQRALRAASPAIRLALADGASAAACRRVGRDRSALSFG